MLGAGAHGEQIITELDGWRTAEVYAGVRGVEFRMVRDDVSGDPDTRFSIGLEDVAELARLREEFEPITAAKVEEFKNRERTESDELSDGLTDQLADLLLRSTVEIVAIDKREGLVAPEWHLLREDGQTQATFNVSRTRTNVKLMNGQKKLTFAGDSFWQFVNTVLEAAA